MIQVDENRLDGLLYIVYDQCLVCPPPYDFSSDDYDGTVCPRIRCDECWKRYLMKKDPKE